MCIPRYLVSAVACLLFFFSVPIIITMKFQTNSRKHLFTLFSGHALVTQLVLVCLSLDWVDTKCAVAPPTKSCGLRYKNLCKLKRFHWLLGNCGFSDSVFGVKSIGFVFGIHINCGSFIIRQLEQKGLNGDVKRRNSQDCDKCRWCIIDSSLWL